MARFPVHCWRWAAPLALVVALAGCAHKKDYEGPEIPIRGVMGPRVPPFVVGPAALLLTNISPYSAYLEFRSAAAGPESTPVAGHLLSRGNRILFAPGTEPEADKRLPAGGFAWLWDAAEQRGWIFSETLQGYAPISARQKILEVKAGQPTPVARRPQNHPCEQVRYDFTLEPNAAKTLQALRATDLDGLPMEIVSDEPGAAYTITLSRHRREQPPENLFSPPESFTAYPSAEAMVDELAMRQRKLRGGRRY